MPPHPVPAPRHGARLDGSRVVHSVSERNALVRYPDQLRQFVAFRLDAAAPFP